MGFMNKRKEKAETIKAYQRLFDSIDGQRVLTDMLKQDGFMSVGLGETPYDTAYNQGKRAGILRILNIINIEPEAIINLLKDNRKE